MRTCTWPIGFRTAGFQERPLLQALRSIREADYDGVEVCLEHPDFQASGTGRSLFAQVRRELSALGLQLLAVSHHGKFAEWPEKRLSIERALSACAEMECRVLIVSALACDEEDAAARFSQMAELLAWACAMALRRGVVLAVEPEPGTVIHGSSEMTRLLRVLNTPALGVNLDIGHAFLADGAPHGAIVQFGSRIVHTHVEDIKGAVHEHRIPGDGDIDFARVWSALRAVDYRGAVTLDLFRITQDPEGICRRARHALRARMPTPQGGGP